MSQFGIAQLAQYGIVGFRILAILSCIFGCAGFIAGVASSDSVNLASSKVSSFFDTNINSALSEYRYSREKLTTEVDLDSLSEEKKKNIKKKLSRCTNAEESLLKEMYLIKSWKANDVFEMLLKHEPVPFDDACQIAHDTGNLDLRARERIRQYKLVLPVWERLNKGMKLELPFLNSIF